MSYRIFGSLYGVLHIAVEGSHEARLTSPVTDSYGFKALCDGEWRTYSFADNDVDNPLTYTSPSNDERCHVCPKCLSAFNITSSISMICVVDET